MTKKPTLCAAAVAAASTALLLAACGGSDDNTPIEDPTLVPQSATSSTTAWVSFAKALMTSDTGAALELTAVGTLPVSDTEEPQAL